MEAKETKFLRFINTPKQLVIPIYQRTYSWSLKQCEQLWKDICRVGSDETLSGHFIGSIVYVEKGLYQVTSLPKLLVIDGQQRLTTISLLISALCNYIKNKKEIIELNYEKLISYYLINDKEDGEDKYKLILTKSDKETLFKIIEGRELLDEDSACIKENYQFFFDKISETDLNIVYNGISKLIIIDVSLDKEKDDPQLIFESLNSTGLALTQADLIRNYILMGLEQTQQEEIYNNYWYPMEKGFGHSEKSELFDRFMRDYLTIKLSRIPTMRDIYTEFKQYSFKINNVPELIKDVYKFSKYFVNIALGKETDMDIKNAFLDINELKVDVSYPFILSVYQDYINSELSKEEFIEILRLIESYVFRRAICGVPTASLNKTFATLYKSVNKEQYVLSIKLNLIVQESYRRFPNDEEFKKEAIIKDMYSFRNRNYVLRRLENYNRKELVDVESYTIEHIMPQNSNLSEEWINNLGENWKEIQKNYLHTIGNLTLTGYNSELSDNSFKIKRDMTGGFKDSPIRLNRSLAILEKWNEDSIKIRSEEIITLMTEIWTFPTAEKSALDKYMKDTEQIAKQKYTIDDHQYLREGEPMRQLFDKLRKRILNIESSVREEPTKLYIAYKSITNFVDIIPQKRALCLILNIPFNKIKDPSERCTDITGIGKWGNGDVEFRLTSETDLDYAISLVKQAFDNVMGVENSD